MILGHFWAFFLEMIFFQKAYFLLFFVWKRDKMRLYRVFLKFLARKKVEWPSNVIYTFPDMLGHKETKHMT